MTDGYLTFGLDELKEIIEITFRLKEAVLRFQKTFIMLSRTKVRKAVLKPIIDLFSCLLVQNSDSFFERIDQNICSEGNYTGTKHTICGP
jgi:hypothetical protein